jgi:hypothetical protein
VRTAAASGVVLLVLIAGVAACGRGTKGGDDEVEYVVILRGRGNDFKVTNSAVEQLRAAGIHALNESTVGLDFVSVPEADRARAEELLRAAGLPPVRLPDAGTR